MVMSFLLTHGTLNISPISQFHTNPRSPDRLRAAPKQSQCGCCMFLSMTGLPHIFITIRRFILQQTLRIKNANFTYIGVSLSLSGNNLPQRHLFPGPLSFRHDVAMKYCAWHKVSGHSFRTAPAGSVPLVQLETERRIEVSNSREDICPHKQGNEGDTVQSWYSAFSVFGYTDSLLLVLYCIFFVDSSMAETFLMDRIDYLHMLGNSIYSIPGNWRNEVSSSAFLPSVSPGCWGCCWVSV